ncbi:hypothetical protein BOX15_Mlig024744g4 [Macrostomum lignano]|uniref:RUN and TBC1 domain-containing protein 3 n=1 Tax=Macrostomum lignano TaxID=282301 RepID=A0A267F3A2_9PLAT|nr:hypothetical protein BOX15_Mlig024744g4 [Macrostomum lignano]
MLATDESIPVASGPFSALTPSMRPQEFANLSVDSSEQSDGELDYNYDEFGFRIEEDDTLESSAAAQSNDSQQQQPTPFVEDPAERLKWTNFLELTYASFTKDTASSSASSLGGAAGAESISSASSFLSTSATVSAGSPATELPLKLPVTDKLKSMVRSGVPHSLRGPVWLRLSGALEKRRKSPVSYNEIVKESSQDTLATSKHIEKDLLRTLPSNVCFSHAYSTGVPRLRRILRALAWLYPDIGYCQGTGVVAATLLLLMEEEDAFWQMTTIIEDYLPACYYTSTLLGVQADQRVLRELLPECAPDIDALLREHDIELSLITLHWFLTLFAGVLPVRILLRVWDQFFCEGSIVLFQTTVAILKLHEAELKSLENTAEIFNCLSSAPTRIGDIDCLLEALNSRICLPINQSTVTALRGRFTAALMADEGGIISIHSVPNLPKQKLNKRQIARSRFVISSLLWGSESNGVGGPGSPEDQEKAKNVRQTELLVTLRDAIHQIGRHFKQHDAKHSNIVLQADYGLESHAQDLEHYVQVARGRRRRVKALLDFERHDDDELGFRKNDIITVISMRDEHCWVGELNGLRGWFPAKFVELLDERSKDYSSAGDDSVNEGITDLVRGVFCPAFKEVFEHGLKRSHLLGGTAHPWLFVEEASAKEVEKDFNSVYSRLVLCKTFRLDEDGKVLTPEEILYRAVQTVNLTHDAAHAQMDVKFRSLMCYGLNEQVLHLWLEALCSCEDVVKKWYHSWSFLRSPGWVQIKCELRLLAQFAFRLNILYELPKGKVTKDTKVGIREDVRDMLIKHHLFSWELD